MVCALTRVLPEGSCYAKRVRYRVPFVVTVALGAVACSSDDAAVDGSDAGSNDAASETSSGPCPADKPIPGTACDEPALVCNYTGQMNACGSPSIETATCVSNIWYLQIDTGVCDAGLVPCPETEPKPGEACDVTPGDLCQYDSGGCCPNGYACVANQFYLVPLDCNPPGLECPAEIPTNGSPCDPCAEIYQFCVWGSCETAGGATVGTCDTGGVWLTDTANCGPTD